MLMRRTRITAQACKQENHGIWNLDTTIIVSSVSVTASATSHKSAPATGMCGEVGVRPGRYLIHKEKLLDGPMWPEVRRVVHAPATRADCCEGIHK